MNYKSAHQKIWFVSDLHAGHDKDFILDKRGYAGWNINDVYEDMIKIWNKFVGKDDVVFNLGDMVVGAGVNSYDVATNLISRLNCQHHYFIFGNHNAGVKQIYNEHNKILGASLVGRKIFPLALNEYNFSFLGDVAEIKIDDQQIVLSHYPIARWNNLENGSWNIHGHTHGQYRCLKNQFDVSWDVFLRPVEYHELINISIDREYS